MKPENKRKKCRRCGSFYSTHGEFLDVGLCIYCAKANGQYVQPRRAL